MTEEEEEKIRQSAGCMIRRIRAALGETIEKFAETMGISTGRQGDIEKKGTPNFLTMLRYSEYSSKSIFFFIYSILPSGMRERQISLFMSELDDMMISESHERDRRAQEKQEEKLKLCHRADEYAKRVLSFEDDLTEDDRHYIDRIISILYQHTELYIKEHPIYVKDTGEIVSDADKEFIRQMIRTADKLAKKAAQSQKRKEEDVFLWLDLCSPSYTYPYIRELSGLPGMYKNRLMILTSALLDRYMTIMYPDGKKHRTVKKDLLMLKCSDSGDKDTTDNSKNGIKDD